MAKKVFKVLGIVLVVLIALIVIILKWSDATVGVMTEPIRQEFAARTSDKFRISKSVYGETEGTAIVAITDKDGQTYEEKYFLKKTEDVWAIDKKEPYIAPTSTVENTTDNTTDNTDAKTNFKEITIVDEDETVPSKDGDMYVISERKRYYARVILIEPLTKTTSFKHTYKKTAGGFARGFITEAIFPKDPPLTNLYVELKTKDGSLTKGTYESMVTVGNDSAVLKYRVE